MTEIAAKYSTETETNEQKVDAIIADIAEAFVNDIGTEAAWDQLQTLLGTQDRVANGRSWKAMEWIGAHLVSILQDETHEGMLANGLCPYCSSLLRTKRIPATHTSPAEQWIVCPNCRASW